MAVNSRDKSLQRFIAGVLEEGIDTAAKRFYYDDPTTQGFSLMFDFEGKNSPLFNESANGESAIKYLENIDEGDRRKWDSPDFEDFEEEGGRAAKLKRFKERLRDLVKLYPYYFTDIQGLGDVYNFKAENAYEFERKLTIKTLESIDMRIGGLINDYHEAEFDVFQRREMLPGNMKEFRLYVIVSEIRNFRTFVNQTLTGKDADRQKEMGLIGVTKQPILTNINENLGVYVFIFDNCRFDFEDSGQWLEGIKNSSPEVRTNSFAIKTGRMQFANRLNFLDLFTSSIPDTDRSKDKTNVVGKQNDSRFENVKKDFLNTQLGKALAGNADLAGNLFNREADEFLQTNDPRLVASRVFQNQVVNLINSKIQNVLLGNVFSNSNEFRNVDLSDNASKFITDLIKNNSKQQERKIASNVFGPKETTNFGEKEDLGSKDVGSRIDFSARETDFTRVALGNVLGFNEAPFSALLEHMVKSNLGNVFDR